MESFLKYLFYGCETHGWLLSEYLSQSLTKHHTVFYFNHNMCENRLEEVQGAATSSLFPPPLFQDTRPRVRNTPCQWDLTIDKAKPPTSAEMLLSVRSEILHASETWPLTKPNLRRLQRNDREMIRQICNVKPQDTVTTRSTELLARLGIEYLNCILKERRLRWYGHVESSNGAVKTAFDIQVDVKHGPGRHKLTWKQLTERDCREWKLSAIDPHDRHTYRFRVRCAMRAARQLPGRGAHWCGCCPCICTLIKHSMMMMKTFSVR